MAAAVWDIVVVLLCVFSRSDADDVAKLPIQRGFNIKG